MTLGALETVHSVLSLLQRANVLPGPNDNSVAGRAVRGVAILLRHYCLPRLLNERFGPDGSDERVVLCQRTLPRKRDVAPTGLIHSAWANYEGVAYRFGGRNLDITKPG